MISISFKKYPAGTVAEELRQWRGKQTKNFDWYGNNAAVTCLACEKVFIVSEQLNPDGAACPSCGMTSVKFKEGNPELTIQFGE